MAQAVSRWPLPAEARVRVRAIPCGICVNKVALGHVFLRVPRFPLSTSFHLFNLVYHPGEEQSSLQRPQFRGMVSPHRHEQQEQCRHCSECSQPNSHVTNTARQVEFPLQTILKSD
jgi:hypothetical protein